MPTADRHYPFYHSDMRFHLGCRQASRSGCQPPASSRVGSHDCLVTASPGRGAGVLPPPFPLAQSLPMETSHRISEVVVISARSGRLMKKTEEGAVSNGVFDPTMVEGVSI